MKFDPGQRVILETDAPFLESGDVMVGVVTSGKRAPGYGMVLVDWEGTRQWEYAEDLIAVKG